MSPSRWHLPVLRPSRARWVVPPAPPEPRARSHLTDRYMPRRPASPSRQRPHEPRYSTLLDATSLAPQLAQRLRMTAGTNHFVDRRVPPRGELRVPLNTSGCPIGQLPCHGGRGAMATGSGRSHITNPLSTAPRRAISP